MIYGQDIIRRIEELVEKEIMGYAISRWQAKPTTLPMYRCENTGIFWDIDDPFSPATDLNHALEVMQKLTKDPNVSVHLRLGGRKPAICLAALSAKGVEFPAE